MSGSINEYYKNLCNRVNKHANEYYGSGESTIPDCEYDRLVGEIKALETDYPDLVKADSPTKRVGAKAVTTNTFKHLHPMLSLDNVFNQSELESWYSSAVKELDYKFPLAVICEEKIDGCAISLHYKRGALILAVLRGDGEVGDIYTLNAKQVLDIPSVIKHGPFPDELEVRGEVYVNREDFTNINNALLAAGKKAYKTPRNFAAGSLRLKNPNEVAKRLLRFKAYSAHGEGLKASSQFQTLARLREWGFSIPLHELGNLPKAMEYINKLDQGRETLPNDIDGVVIKLNEFETHDVLGVTGRIPRWATAWKFKAKEVKTTLLDVAYQVGRTGVITPVAVLTPVIIDGVEVSSATLHNVDEIKRLNLGKGCQVYLSRQGDVIPKVTGKVQFKGNVGEPIVTPAVCPCCGSTLVRVEGEVAIRCLNAFGCKGRIIAWIKHFVSRKAMNIDGLGDVAIEELVNLGEVKTPEDLYILAFNGPALFHVVCGAANGEKVRKNIMLSIKPKLSSFIFALGIPEVGIGTAKVLARNVKDVEELEELSLGKLLALPDIGPVTADAIHVWLSTISNHEMLTGLLTYIQPENPEYVTTAQTLQGTTYVLTGSYERYSRSAWAAKIEALGGKVSSNVSKNTTAVVVGVNPTEHKVNSAIALGVRVISEDVLETLLTEATAEVES